MFQRLAYDNNYALDFDGSNDRLTIPSFNLSGSSLSISAWYNADTITNDTRIVSKATSTDPVDHYWMMGFDDTTIDEYRFRIVAGGTDETYDIVGASTGSWIHMAAVYNGSTMSIYQNGVLVGSTAKTGSVRQGDVPIWIGDNQPQGSRPFDGKIRRKFVFMIR